MTAAAARVAPLLPPRAYELLLLPSRATTRARCALCVWSAVPKGVVCAAGVPNQLGQRWA
jgi:hypothetical protein